MRLNGTTRDPLQDPLYRLVKGVSRFQLRTRLQRVEDPRPLLLAYAATCGGAALGIITLMSVWTRMPLLFPPLAPSAFILFTMPLSPAGSPRNLILSHSSATAIGLITLRLAHALWPEADLLGVATMSAERVAVIAVAMGATTAVMIRLRIQHPPAAASATLAATGFLDIEQALGLVTATLMLAAQAVFMVRILAGLPYPLWRSDPRAVRNYGELAGVIDDPENRWRRLRDIICRTRTQ